MADVPLIRNIPRNKLLEIFKTLELVKLFEDVLYSVGTALPADTTAVRAALTAHTASTTDAHMASAIGSIPAGDVAANNVQAAINELDTDKQPRDATLTALAGLATNADLLPYFTAIDTAGLAVFTAFARALLDDPDASAALSTLGVSAFAKTILDDADASAARTTLGLAIGTNVQAYSAALTTWAGKTAPAGTVVGTSDPQALTAKTLDNPIITGSAFFEQGATTTKAAAATLTAAELLTKIIEYTGAADSLTMPTGTDLDAGVLSGALPADRAFEFVILNRGTGTATLVTAAGITLTGTMTVPTATSARFRARKTAANTFTVYRLA